MVDSLTAMKKKLLSPTVTASLKSSSSAPSTSRLKLVAWNLGTGRLEAGAPVELELLLLLHLYSAVLLLLLPLIGGATAADDVGRRAALSCTSAAHVVAGRQDNGCSFGLNGAAMNRAAAFRS